MTIIQLLKVLQAGNSDTEVKVNNTYSNAHGDRETQTVDIVGLRFDENKNSVILLTEKDIL